MRASITYQVEVDSVQKLTALRDRLGADLETDDDVGLTASASAVEDQQFTVLGAIKGKPDGPPYSVVVHAQDKDEAATKALERDEKRTVVAVLGGVVPVG